MQRISYKMEYSVLELVFGLIGPAIILISIFYPVPDMKIGTLRLHLPEGVANAVLGLLGLGVTYLTAGMLLKKRAANSQGTSIVLDAEKMIFTTVQKFRGVLMTVNYDAIEKIIITNIPETSTTAEEKMVEIRMPSLVPKRHEFDAIHMSEGSDFELLVDTLKHRAANAVFEVN